MCDLVRSEDFVEDGVHTRAPRDRENWAGRKRGEEIPGKGGSMKWPTRLQQGRPIWGNESKETMPGHSRRER